VERARDVELSLFPTHPFRNVRESPFLPGNDSLAWGVEVGRNYHAIRRLYGFQDLTYTGANDGGHSAGVLPGRLSHQLVPLRHEPRPVFQA
jgi:hypothetical protein